MRKLLIIVVASFIVACAAPQKTQGEDRAPGRGLMGADDAPLTEVWNDWTPALGPSTPAELADSASAFDYWQVTDEAFVDEAWGAIFAVLGQFRTQVEGRYDDTFRALMTLLEEDEAPRRFDLTFVVSKSGAQPMWEGVLARVYRELPDGAAPGVAVLMRRSEGGSEELESASLWFFSGFVEAPSLSATVQPAAAGGNTTLSKGITLQDGAVLAADDGLVKTVLQEIFWRPLTGTQYMENEITRRETVEQTPAPQPIAAGLELGDRDIDQVFSDSVFAPRLTIFPSKTNP